VLAVAFALSCGGGMRPSMMTGVAGSGGTAGTGAAGTTGGAGIAADAGADAAGIGGGGPGTGGGGAGTGGSSGAGAGGRGGNLCEWMNGIVDPGPFEFLRFAYSETFFIGGPPGGVVSYSIDKDGAVSSTQYGCNGQATADVLATFVQKATSPELVAPFLCNKPCQPNVADATIAATLTLANRQTYVRCDFGTALVSAGWAVVNATCGPRDAAADAPAQ